MRNLDSLANLEEVSKIIAFERIIDMSKRALLQELEMRSLQTDSQKLMSKGPKFQAWIRLKPRHSNIQWWTHFKTLIRIFLKTSNSEWCKILCQWVGAICKISKCPGFKCQCLSCKVTKVRFTTCLNHNHKQWLLILQVLDNRHKWWIRRWLPSKTRINPFSKILVKSRHQFRYQQLQWFNLKCKWCININPIRLLYKLKNLTIQQCLDFSSNHLLKLNNQIHKDQISNQS